MLFQSKSLLSTWELLSTTGFDPLKSILKDNTAEILFNSNQGSKTSAFLFATRHLLQLHSGSCLHPTHILHRFVTEEPCLEKTDFSPIPQRVQQCWEPAWGSCKRDIVARCLHLFYSIQYAKEESDRWNQSFSALEPLLCKQQWFIHQHFYLAQVLSFSKKPVKLLVQVRA